MSNVIPIRQLTELAKVRIPRRFWNASLDNYRPQTPSQASALRAVRWWVTAGRLEGAMLALIGRQGTGKSHLLYAAAHAIIEARQPAFIRSWYAFADELRFGSGTQAEAGTYHRTPAEIRASWWEAPCVLLDEIRATAGTNFDDTELSRYACHAYDAERAVLVTTNINPLSMALGEAAASRFREIVIDGPDMRKAEVA